MILDANQFTGYDVESYLQFIESAVMWFDAFYQEQQQMRSVRTKVPRKFLLAEDGLGIPINGNEGK